MSILKFIPLAILLFNGRRTYCYIKFLFTGNYLDRYNVSGQHRRSYDYYDGVLSRNFHYYRKLSPVGKNKFLARLSKVMNKVEFVGNEGLEITDEMKISVLFSKIQLTYGLDFFHFERFSKYIIYPGTFYSRFFERDLKGLTSGAGFVMLSWQDFQEGYFVDNDKFNLGLHEMAHALRLELKDYKSLNYKIQSLNRLMDEKAIDEMNMYARGVPSILRKYAFSNHEEFFAVCIEYFFEVPELLKETKPDIFEIICEMLNQNPLNHSIDYRVN